MKTLKILTAATLLFLSATAFASDDVKSAKLNMNYTVQTYIDAVAHGKTKPLPDVLDSDVKLTITIRDNIVNYNKSEILKVLKTTENVEQNCSTSYTIIEQGSTLAVVKVILQYPGFSKVSFLNMADTKTGWKITNVSDSYK